MFKGCLVLQIISTSSVCNMCPFLWQRIRAYKLLWAAPLPLVGYTRHVFVCFPIRNEWEILCMTNLICQAIRHVIYSQISKIDLKFDYINHLLACINCHKYTFCCCSVKTIKYMPVTEKKIITCCIRGAKKVQRTEHASHSYY